VQAAKIVDFARLIECHAKLIIGVQRLRAKYAGDADNGMDHAVMVLESDGRAGLDRQDRRRERKIVDDDLCLIRPHIECLNEEKRERRS
jgi:hypothetical protein